MAAYRTHDRRRWWTDAAISVALGAFGAALAWAGIVLWLAHG